MTKNYLLKVVIICAVLCQFFNKASAQYAIGGTAGNTLVSSVYWLKWDPTETGTTMISSPNGADSQHIINGTYVWQYSPTVRITAIISNENFINGGAMMAYTPGNFTGDGLDLLYSGNNLPKPDSRGVENSGMATTGGETVSFDIDLKVAILINGIYTDVVYPGMVIGDAESIDSQGEFISGDTPNAVAWQLLNKRTQQDPSDAHYLMDLSNNGRSFKLRADLAPGNFGVQAVMFAHGARNLSNLTMLGSGITAMAIGFVLPFDENDAPTSYGSAGHYIDNFAITDVFQGDGTYPVVNYPTTPLTPQATVYIGANNVDADGNVPFSTHADGDNTTGANDESTITPSTLPDIKVNQPGDYSITLPVTNTKNTTATLYGWVDFNRDGAFTSDELVTATVPANASNQSIVLTWPNAQFRTKVKTGILYTRFRITTTALLDDAATTTVDERATAFAADGEVEDYELKAALGISIAGTVRNDPSGTTDGVISGTGIGTVSGTQLFAYLVSGTTIIDKATVAANGTYTFSGANNGSYTIAISTNNVAVGAALNAVSANLPAAWVPSGETFGTNNAAGTGLETGTPNMQIALTTPGTSLDITGVDFGADQIPVAVSDAATTVSGQAVTVNVLANDSDPDGTIDLTQVRVVDPADGVGKTTVTIANQGTYVVNTTTGVVTFTPLTTFAGASTPVSYTIKDNFGAPASSLVTTQISVAVRPVGVNDNNFTEVNTPVTTNVKANDGAVNANATVTAGNGTNGTTVTNASGQVTYTPANNFVGTDTFTYTLTNGGQVSDPITVTIIVTNVPTGLADASTTPIATPVTTNVQANDGTFGTASTVAQGTAPGHGSIVVNADQTITYTPVATFTGKDTYTYIITKNGNQSTPITVTITVVPVGVNDSYSTPVNTAITSTVKSNDGNSGLGTTVAATAGAHGTTSVNGSNLVTYTPVSNFIGTDSYTYTLTTADGVASSAITVNVTIKPAGVADASTTLIGTPVITNVTTNDGISATGATVTPTAGGHGTTAAVGGQVTYTPAAGFVGVDTYTYTLTNNTIVSDPITVTITVNPVAVNDVATTPINTPVATNVTANDGASGTGATVTPTNGGHGTTAVSGPGTVTYTPGNNYIGLDTYTYTLTNNGATSGTATVTVSIRPVGVADASTTPVNTAVTTSVKTNDGGSASGTTLAATAGAHGTTAVNNTTGQITYTPTTGYVGTDTYTYTLTTADNVVSDPITVTITVTPVGVNDSAVTPINTAVAITVTANDGASGTGATVTPTTPAHGTATVTGTGIVTYTPANGYTGLDSYTYTLTNNGATSAPITVSVSVKPVGVADASTTPINTAVTTTVKTNDGASGSNAGTTVAATAGGHGTTAVNASGQVTFTPANNYIGNDTYTYTLTTADGVVSDPINVVITVNPVGVNDVATTPINTAVATTVTGNDGVSGTGATITPTAGTHGTTAVTGTGVVTYTPALNYMGLDSYTYTLTNNGATSAPITVNVSVRPAGSPDAAITATNTPVSVTVKGNDGNSATGTTVVAGNGTNGTTTVNAAGVVTYTPTTGFNGTDTFTYTLNTADGVASNPILVTITVNPRPVGVADASTTPVNTAVTTTVTANDGTDGVGASVALGTVPAHGTAQVNGDNSITFTPTNNYIGLDTYTYTLTKGGLTSTPITVTISVRPVGVNDAAVTNINTAIATTVKTNDGISGTGTTVTPAAGAHGTTTADGSGVVTYTPTTGYIGLDSYTYTLTTTDGVVSSPITVNVTVRPVAVADVATTPINTAVATTVKANDGASGTGTTVTTTTPAHGTLVVDGNGVVTYTPTTNYVGTDTYTYTLTTPDGVVSDPVAVTISITPTGVADIAATTINTPVTTTVTANDGAAAIGATVTPANGTHGTTTVNASNQVTYTPAAGYIGKDTYTYTLTNNGTTSGPITVTVTVAPVGVNDAATTPINTAIATTVKTNDGASATGTTVTAGNGTHGTTATDAAGVVTYTPANNYIGLDTYTYTLTTADGAVSAPITVNVSVTPVAVADVATTTINTPVATTVKTNDGPSGTGTTVTVSTLPTHGTVTVGPTGVVTYTPATGYVGPDNYSYTLTTTDGVVSPPVAVTISVSPGGVADVAATVINTPITTTVTANDGPSGVGATVTAGNGAHGTTTVNASGQVTYTPATGYIGLDSYTYTLTNNGSTSAPITVSVTVAPVGVNDAATTPINTAVPTTVKTNDGASATGTTVAVATAPAHGTTAVDGTGVVTYTPTNNYIGLDTYTYTLATADGATSAPVTVNVSVRPVGVADASTTLVNTAVTTTVKTNDGASATGTTVVALNGSHGTTTVNGTGQVVYTPATDFAGIDTYTYTLNTTDGVSSTPITVTINVRPSGLPDVATTTIGIPVATTVKGNDGTSASTSTVTPTTPAHGTVTVDPQGVVTYTPTPGYTGPDSYTYTLTTPDGIVSDPIAVTLSVKPVGVTDADVTNINTAVTTTVKTNDGLSGTGTTVVAGNGTHGTTAVNGAGQVIYTPATDYIGKDTYTYTLNAGTVASDPITVNISVKPTGVADVITTTAGIPVTTPVKTNDGPSGTGTTVAIATPPTHGTTTVDPTGQVTYTPTAGYVGPDTYTYTLTTPDGVVSDPITVTVAVGGIPVGTADIVNTPINTAATTNVIANDADGATSTVSAGTAPGHGAIVVNADKSITFTPTNNYIGKDTYTYILTKASIPSAPITVTVNIRPVGVADVDTTLIGVAKTTIVKDNDGASGTGTTVLVVLTPLHGATTVNASGLVVYTPAANYTGRDNYTYTLTTADGVVSDVVSVTMIVKPVGVADNDATNINTAKTTAVKTNDGASGTQTGTTIFLDGTPSHGTISVNQSSGLVTYTPTTGYIGKDTYFYQLVTADGTSSVPIAVNISVKPIGVTDVTSTTQNTAVPITVKGNDGASGAGTTVAVATPPAHGTTTVSPTGVVTYTPATGYTGQDIFTYTLTTPDGVVSDPITVSLTIGNLPTGVSDFALTQINQAVTTNVLQNDGTGAVTPVTQGTAPAHGTILVNASGTITYTPANNYIGQDTYTYTFTKAGVTSAPVSVTVAVLPLGVADAYSTTVNTPVTFAVKANDNASAVGTSVAESVSPSHGSIVVNADNTVTYTPANNYVGTDTYTYTLTTTDGVTSDDINVTVTISSVPVGVADVATTTIGLAVTTPVTANDGTAATGATVGAGTAPVHGAIVVNGDNTITYTPVATFTGIDTYTYTLTKAGITSAPITVTVSVKPLGVADAVTTNINTPIGTTVKGNDGNSANGTTVTIGTAPVHGTTAVSPTGVVTYTPATGYLGNDTYTYILTTADGVASDPVNVSVTVTTLPVGVTDNRTTAIGVPISIDVTTNDGPDGTGSTVAAGTAPTHGTIVVNADRTITYTPVSTYMGNDTFTYTLTKNGQTSLPITVNISVKPQGVNDAVFTSLNTAILISVKDNDGASRTGTTVAVVTTPAHGAAAVNASGQITYTPVTGFTGTDTFTYTLTTVDGVVSDPVTVNVTINTATQGVPDTDFTTINQSKTTTVTTNDGAVATGATVSVASQPAHGTASANATGTITYTPATDYVGLDTYTYILTNGSTVSNPVTVTMSVKPTGVFDGAITPINTPVTTQVSANDGPSNLTTTVVPTNGAHGTTTVDAAGNVTYTPVTGFTGTDTYTYTLVTPDGVSSDPISVTVSIRLIGVDDAATTPVGVAITVDVKANDGPSGTGATVTISTPPAHGTAQVDATGKVKYTPAANFSGVDVYKYNLSIPGAVSDAITVTITVISQGVNDVVVTDIEKPVTTDVKANDGPTNTNATVAIATAPVQGTVLVNANNTVTYSPFPNYVGTDTYTYTLANGAAISAPVTVTVTIRPVGVADSYTMSVNTTRSLPITANDGGSGVNAVTSVVTPPAHGTVTFDAATNNAVYTPAANYVGGDTFTYKLTKNGVSSNPITVAISIAPSGVNDTDLTPINTPVTTNVKANDGTAAAGAAVVLLTGPVHGTAVVNPDGTVTYTPATGYTGPDTYTYQLTSGTTQSAAITVNITVYTASMRVTKVANNTGSKAGDVINYTIIVTNTGNITLTNVAVVDPGADPGSITPAFIGTLSPPNQATVTAKHTLTQADIDNGGFTNIAYGTGTDPKGNPIGTPIPGSPGTPGVPSTDPTSPTGGGTVSPITPAGSVSLTKSGVATATTITYTFVIKNTGNVTLTSIALTDAKLGLSSALIAGLPAGGLLPGVSFTYPYAYTLTQADRAAGSVANTASVTGTDTKGNPYTGTGSTTTTVPPLSTAADDTSPTTGGQPVVTHVLDNDTPGLPVTGVEIVTQPAHGKVTVNPDGTITYTPDNGFSAGDTYTYHVKDPDGYYTNTATVTIVNTFVNITVPTLFTPNGDGINDVFEIRGLGQFAEASIEIVNRWGNLVFKTSNYQNNWAGEGLNEGTYYYVLSLKRNVGDSPIVLKGYTTLIRAFRK